MNKVYALNEEDFNKLLTWLDTDRNRAGQRYEEIRRNLVRIFIRRQCVVAEELADQTIDRACRKARQVAETYNGDPALYFYGVAQNVYKEYLKKNLTG